MAAVQKAGAATGTTQRLKIDADVTSPQGSPHLTDDLQNGDRMTAISEACTFFLRPNSNDPTRGPLARADGVHEYASLYNPYWQARLTTPELGWTSLLNLAIGAPFLNALTP